MGQVKNAIMSAADVLQVQHDLPLHRVVFLERILFEAFDDLMQLMMPLGRAAVSIMARAAL